MIKMKKVKIRYWYIINRKTKKNEEVLNVYGGTFHDLLNLLFEKYGNTIKEYFLDPDKRHLSTNITVFINNKPVRDLAFKLKNGDEILIMPNIGGG